MNWLFLVNIQGDFETLKKYCSPQLIERCKAEHGAYKDRGIFCDNKVRLLLFLCQSFLLLSVQLHFVFLSLNRYLIVPYNILNT